MSPDHYRHACYRCGRINTKAESRQVTTKIWCGSAGDYIRGSRRVCKDREACRERAGG